MIDTPGACSGRPSPFVPGRRFHQNETTRSPSTIVHSSGNDQSSRPAMLSSMKRDDGVAPLDAAPRRIDEHGVLGERPGPELAPRQVASSDGFSSLDVGLVGAARLVGAVGLLGHALFPLIAIVEHGR